MNYFIDDISKEYDQARVDKLLICLNFMLCFLLVPLYTSTITPSKGTCAEPLIIL